MWNKGQLKEWQIQITSKVIPPVDRKMSEPMEVYWKNGRDGPGYYTNF